MASPQYEVFFVYDNSGAPAPGLTIGAGGLHFTTYKDETGTNLGQPTIVEIGGGAYRFQPVFTSGHGIVYVISTGSNPLYVNRFIRPEDFNLDKIDTLLAIGTGKWEIVTTGADANRLILYDVDGVTVIKKFDLFDSTGASTYLNPFKRNPI